MSTELILRDDVLRGGATLIFLVRIESEKSNMMVSSAGVKLFPFPFQFNCKSRFFCTRRRGASCETRFLFSREDSACLRHLFAGIVTLTVLGMLARIREMEVLVRWSTVHWDDLREPLGFDREQPPCATTISRTFVKCSVVRVSNSAQRLA